MAAVLILAVADVADGIAVLKALSINKDKRAMAKAVAFAFFMLKNVKKGNNNVYGTSAKDLSICKRKI